MNWLVFLTYPILLLLLFWGAKSSPKGTFHEEFLSLSQTKAMQGFAAICVMLHHIGQNTCAPWLDAKIKIHGLNPFVPIGYLFVALFFFCSGYGLMKSYDTKENYLNHFFIRRCLRPILILVLSDLILILLMVYLPRIYRPENTILIPTPFHMGGAILLNDYSWFIYAILIMYLFFWISFRFFNRTIATILVCILTTLYIAFCDWWMYGNWWYNSIVLFPLGLIFAQRESALVSVIQKKYIPTIVSTGILFLICFCVGEYTPYLLGLSGNSYHYFVWHWVVLIAQMISAVCFVLLLILSSMKLKIRNNVLGFFGTVTAEFYLMHILWMRLIGSASDKELLWNIDNLALYILVITLLTTLTALLLSLINHLIVRIVSKKPLILRLLKKDFYVLCGITIVFLIYYVVCVRVESVNSSKQCQPKLEAYEKEHILFTEVDGLNMAAYVVGEGEHTIVLLGGSTDVYSTISLRPLANRLAESNRVIVLDYFGCGFSDTTTIPRTADRYVYEIRTALTGLGESGPYIFMPSEISGLYALLYATQYPKEVEAIIGIDTAVSTQPNDTIASLGLTADAYRIRLQRESLALSPRNRFLRYTGLNRLTWPFTEEWFKYTQSEHTLPLLEELNHVHNGNQSYLSAYELSYDNHMRLSGVTYPKDLPVLSLVGSQSCEGVYYYPESDWRKLHESLITNPDIQEVVEIPGNPYMAFFLPKEISQAAQQFINRLETSEE